MRASFSVPVLAILAVAGVCLTVQSRPANASEGYGSVTGRFVFDGDVPEPRLIIKKGDPGVKDPQICAAQDLLAEDLVIDPKSKGIAHIFVYMRAARQVHPDLKEPAESEVVFDQKNCRFTPHTLVVRTKQDVVVKSDDPVPHNTHTYPLRNKAENFVVRPNDRVGVPISHNAAEILPIEVKCDFHPHMKAYWLILDHPYATLTNEKGEFTIEKLPAGEHEFRVWQELTGYVPLPDIPRRGVLKVTVKPDEVTDLGEIKLTADTFKE